MYRAICRSSAYLTECRKTGLKTARIPPDKQAGVSMHSGRGEFTLLRDKPSATFCLLLSRSSAASMSITTLSYLEAMVAICLANA